ncbi:MAG: hypothetical protein HUK22_01325, partial [Thermoguttaceae bacterium]|nr:hypothetical protein [Thermoguttaceae bacterium]
MTKRILAAAALFAFVCSAAMAQGFNDYLTVEDEAVLIAALEKAGDTPEDIHTTNVVCKRLAIYGSDAAIPALVAMLPNEKLNFNARFALEAIPGDAVDAALAKAANELTGACLVGVIDTIGVRGRADSVEQLVKIYEANDDVAIRKAVCAALGAIATDEAAGFLVSESKKDFSGADILFKRGLGDAILDVAENRENAGNLVAAAALYDAATADAFPYFVREAGIYRALMCRADGAKVVATLKAEKAAEVDAALKTIREFDAEKGVKVAEAVLAAFDGFSEDMQIRLARALGDRKDDASKALAFPKLVDLAKNGSVALKIAAAKALAKAGTVDESAAYKAFADDAANFDDADLSAAIVALAVGFQGAEFDAQVKEFAASKLEKAVADSPVAAALALMKIAEERRVAEAGDALVKIAETKEGAIRDGALAALSEIVSLDNLNLLVAALNGETDDAKVDWILRAACTRMPREACAAKVAEIFAAADLDV